MTNLLHLDSSINGERSHSREITSAFAQAWRASHPDGGYTYRDLAAMDLPHLSGAYVSAGRTPADQRTSEQRTAWDFWQPMRDELLAADVVLLGVPMYNFTVPSTLKSWVDHMVVPEFQFDQEKGTGALLGTKVFAAIARGGSYLPGTPREGWDFQEPWLKAAFSNIGLDQDITFIRAEMTLAYVIEHLAQFRDIADASKENAHKVVQELAAAA
jgi:FMN-dependent NADH-azoreductase